MCRRYRHSDAFADTASSNLQMEDESMTYIRQWSSEVLLFIIISNFIPIKCYHIVLLESYVFTISINSRENLFGCQLFLLLKENYVIHLRIQQNLRENETRFRDVNCLNTLTTNMSNVIKFNSVASPCLEFDVKIAKSLIFLRGGIKWI